MHFRFKAFRHRLMFCGVHFEDWEQNDLKRPRETCVQAGSRSTT